MPNRPIPTEEDRNEPVYYCRHCHSLYVLTDENLADDKWDGSYCGKCNSIGIGEFTSDSRSFGSISFRYCI